MGIRQLLDVVCDIVDWGAIPVNSSPAALATFRDIVFESREQGTVLVSEQSLREMFNARLMSLGTSPVSSSEFPTVLSGARAQGLAWRMRFGNLVLLSPELLDAYASAIVRQARADPSGLGLVDERSVIDAALDWRGVDRIPDPELERLLLFAAVELCIDRELAVREDGKLLFPSVCSTAPPPLEDRPPEVLSYLSPGDGLRNFVRLIVRLSYSGAFDLQRAYAGYAEFTALDGERVDIELQADEAGSADRLIVRTSDRTVPALLGLLFRYIERHIKQYAQGEIVRHWHAQCEHCQASVDAHDAIEARLHEGKAWMWCQYCDDAKAPLPLAIYKAGQPGRLSKESYALDTQVERRRSAEAGVSVIEAKEHLGEFDVFLCYNSTDRPAVEELARRLRERGLRPWLDVWETRPGLPWLAVLEQQIRHVRSAAVIVGPDGPGPWQNQEINAFIRQFVQRQCPVIPVLLPGQETKPELPTFLDAMHHVDLAVGERGFDLLVWGITGRAPAWTM
jgi:hypothetical protein